MFLKRYKKESNVKNILPDFFAFFFYYLMLEGVYVTIGNPAFCLFLYLTGVHFRGELQHGGDVSQQKIKCRPIRTREIGGVSLSDVLYVSIFYETFLLKRKIKKR